MNRTRHDRLAAFGLALTLWAVGCSQAPPREEAASALVPGSRGQRARAIPPLGPAPPAGPAAPTAGAAATGHPAVHGAAGLVWGGLTQDFVDAELLSHAGSGHATEDHEHVQVDPLSAEGTERLVEIEMARFARSNGGALTLQDDLTGEALDLEFVRVRPPVLVLGDHALLAVTLARRLDGPDQLLALDTWIGKVASGGFGILGFRVQAVREGVRREDGPWTVRYERSASGLRPIMTDDERLAARDAVESLPRSTQP